MANATLFAPTRGSLLPRPDTRNREGAPAYAYPPRHRLAQLAVTGCLNGTFYASAQDQLDAVVALCGTVEPVFVAKTAVYCRRRGYMKDMPALLTAILTVIGPDLAARVFPTVIDNGRMLRNFVQIMRSGAVGRKSLGSRPKRLVQAWLEGASDLTLIRASVGQAPSLADVIKMVHPKPADAAREALYGYLVGRDHDATALPDLVRRFEAFKTGATAEVPEVPFQMLTALDLDTRAWTAIAHQLGWQALRMNLNTLARHGVFTVPGMATQVARRLRDADAVKRVRVFPYQLMMAHAAAGTAVPQPVRDALHDAMEVAIANVPALDGTVVVCPDVSGSMGWPVTGWRKGASSAVRCVDVAALVAAAILRRNRAARVLPFNHAVRPVRLKGRHSVMASAGRLSALLGGGTDCSAPLRLLNDQRARVDLVVLVSDNQSWVDATRTQDTGTLREWRRLKRRCPNAKLACIDLQPYGTTQAPEGDDILNVGGFADTVFAVVAAFAKGEMAPDHWVGQIEEMEL